MTLPATILKCELRPGAKQQDLSAAEATIGQALPSDYRRVLEESDGFEGFVDDDEAVFVSFWAASDIAQLNEAYRVGEFLPGVILLGTDGGDTGYGFRQIADTIDYVAVPLVGMSPTEVQAMGGSFDDFLARLGEEGD